MSINLHHLSWSIERCLLICGFIDLDFTVHWCVVMKCTEVSSTSRRQKRCTQCNNSLISRFSSGNFLIIRSTHVVFYVLILFPSCFGSPASLYGLLSKWILWLQNLFWLEVFWWRRRKQSQSESLAKGFSCGNILPWSVCSLSYLPKSRGYRSSGRYILTHGFRKIMTIWWDV